MKRKFTIVLSIIVFLTLLFTAISPTGAAAGEKFTDTPVPEQPTEAPAATAAPATEAPTEEVAATEAQATEPVSSNTPVVATATPGMNRSAGWYHRGEGNDCECRHFDQHPGDEWQAGWRDCNPNKPTRTPAPTETLVPTFTLTPVPPTATPQPSGIPVDTATNTVTLAPSETVTPGSPTTTLSPSPTATVKTTFTATPIGTATWRPPKHPQISVTDRACRWIKITTLYDPDVSYTMTDGIHEQSDSWDDMPDGVTWTISLPQDWGSPITYTVTADSVDEDYPWRQVITGSVDNNCVTPVPPTVTETFTNTPEPTATFTPSPTNTDIPTATWTSSPTATFTATIAFTPAPTGRVNARIGSSEQNQCVSGPEQQGWQVGDFKTADIINFGVSRLNGQINLVDPKNTTEKLGVALNTHPDFDPTGCAEVWSRFEDGAEFGTLWTQAYDGSNQVNLNTLGIEPSWGPVIVYTGTNMNLWQVNPDGSNAMDLGIPGNNADWSPDGTLLAYGGESDHLHVVNYETKVEVFTSEEANCPAPRWDAKQERIFCADGYFEVETGKFVPIHIAFEEVLMSPNGTNEAAIVTASNNGDVALDINLNTFTGLMPIGGDGMGFTSEMEVNPTWHVPSDQRAQPAAVKFQQITEVLTPAVVYSAPECTPIKGMCIAWTGTEVQIWSTKSFQIQIVTDGTNLISVQNGTYYTMTFEDGSNGNFVLFDSDGVSRYRADGSTVVKVFND